MTTTATAPPDHADQAPTRRRGPSRGARLGVAALVVVLAAEAGVRAAGDRIPDPPSFQSDEADTKVDQMDRLSERGGADVVFVGSSLVAAGVAPDRVAEGLGEAAVYNAGLTAGVPLLAERWTRNVVVPRLDPDVVVVGVSSFDFTDHRAGYLFRAAYAESPAGQRAEGTDGLLDRMNRWFADRSELWDRRRYLRDPSIVVDAARGGPTADPWTEGIGPLGGNTSLAGQRFEQRPEGTGPPVGQWSLGTENPAALRALLEGVRAEGARPVLVDMPVTTAYVRRHPGGETDYQRYRAALDELARQTGTPLLRYDDRDVTRFADVVHMNGAGADAFSEQLARDLRLLLDA